MSVVLKDPAFDVLWPQFIFSCGLPEYIEGAVKECQELREEDPKGRSISNCGGWQSAAFRDTEKETLGKLEKHLRDISNEVLPEVIKCNFSVDYSSWWVNISDKNSFNVPHSHGNTKIVAVYYPQVPKGPGNLLLYRPDHNNTLAAENDTFKSFIPEAGRAFFFPGHILHSVVSDQTHEVERISIAYNFY